MTKSVEKILGAYSKEVIIKWVIDRYPVYLNEYLEKELKEARNNLEFDKVNKELDTLFRKLEGLKKKPFDIAVATEMRKNRERISSLIKKQEELLNSNLEAEK